MRRDPIHGLQAGTSAAVGAAGAIVFWFAFPKGSITTLIHDVLHLPGPGAGIALIVGPLIIVLALTSTLLQPGLGGAVVASTAFAVVYALAVWAFDAPTNPKGAFGSAWFMGAAVLTGVAIETVMILGARVPRIWRCMLAGTVANAVLCAFYWIAIFPRTAGWVKLGDMPFLAGLCLAAGIAAGCVACTLARALRRAWPFHQKEPA